MKDTGQENKETICVHPLSEEENFNGAATSGILPSVSYRYLDTELQYPGFYSTYNQKRLGRIMARLEKAAYGMVFSSGMAAITTSILAFLKAGDHIIFLKELYGGTLKFATEELPKRNISCSFAEPDIDSFRTLVKTDTRIIYIETPSNPLLNIVPIDEIVKLAKQHNCITIIDNTFASPVNQLPVPAGIDISVESGTKYLGGHNDLPFGTLSFDDPEFIKPVTSVAMMYGGSLTPYECYLAERSLKTLVIRVKKQNENAQVIAEYLEKNKYINKVYYPGLKSHPRHDLAKKQMTGFGGMISFELDADEAGVKKFQQNLKLITPALSLGGVESLISSPMLTSHRYLSRDERLKLGLNDNLLRFSAGIENSANLIDDIENSIRSVMPSLSSRSLQ